jgi:predicted DNA-binding protein
VDIAPHALYERITTPKRSGARFSESKHVYARSMLNERLQVLIRPDQRQRLEAEAKRRHTSVATLVREAVDAQFGAITPSDRIAAVDALRSMKGRFLSPDELARIGDEERDATLDAMMNAGR